MSDIRVAVIGLDTSHATEFPKRMQDPECPAEMRVEGLRAVSCLRFETPFQNQEGLDARQAYLERIGVKVTESFAEAVADCDAIMMEINDPAYHLEYFEKCAGLGKPIFLDKPFADTLAHAREIIRIAKMHGTRFFTSSPLRFDAGLATVFNELPQPVAGDAWGALGTAPAGSSIVWYGVHVFDMLETLMGQGAQCLQMVDNGCGYTAVVKYADRRVGTVTMTPGSWQYGVSARNRTDRAALAEASKTVSFYTMELKEILRFFQTGEQIVSWEDALETMALLEAADRSARSGREEPLWADL